MYRIHYNREKHYNNPMEKHIKYRPHLGIKIFSLILKLSNFKNGYVAKHFYKKSKSFHRIRPPKFFFRIFDCQKQNVAGHPVWTIKLKNTQAKNHILFFHGGAYVDTFSYFHWRFIAQLIVSQNCIVHAPNYPLAPKNNAPQTIKMALETYKKLLKKPNVNKIIIMGDSAGGGLALALTQLILDKKITPPAHTILLSPWLDISMSNPVIPKIDKHDPLLSADSLADHGKSYAGNLSSDHPYVSPIKGSFHNLPPISIFIGTKDILYPDCLKLHKILDDLKNPGLYFEAPGMLHNWMLYPFFEAIESKVHIFKIVRQTFKK